MREKVGRECPIATWLKREFANEIEAVRNARGLGPSAALCWHVCPGVLGRREDTPDGRCGIRIRLLREA